MYDGLAKTKIKQCQDPDDFLHIMETARDRLHDMEEHISPDRFGDLIINALTPDYNLVRNTSFRDREFGLEDINPRCIICARICSPVLQAHHRLQGAVSPCEHQMTSTV